MHILDILCVVAEGWFEVALDANIPVGHKLVVFGTLNDETREGKLLLDEVVVRPITRHGYFKICFHINICSVPLICF